MSHPRAFTRDELETASPALYSERHPVRFQDVDTAGTIFYPRVLEYFSDAYLSFLGQGGDAIHERIANGSFRTPIVHAEADYLAPLRFGDTMTVEIVEAKVGERSFTLGFRVQRQDGAIAAVGQIVHVNIDPATLKPTPLPDDLRDKLRGKGGGSR
jgi:YbgC/YbaW family acyl-CoA thioester hydrolase